MKSVLNRLLFTDMFMCRRLDEDSYTKDKYRYHADKKWILLIFSYCRFLEGSRYDEAVLGSSLLPIPTPSEPMSQWRLRKKVDLVPGLDF